MSCVQHPRRYCMRCALGTLFRRMKEISTLVMGPSGTGKELVARAIALSQYIPFDPGQQQFTADFTKAFNPVNLSELTRRSLASAATASRFETHC